MDVTAEGLGGRKWSWQEKPGEGGMERVLSQGALEIAVLREPHGREVQHLLVTAPQLWTAANEVVAAEQAFLEDDTNANSNRCVTAVMALADMVAKAVGKQRWADVAQ